jgi:hypothetical protein
VRQCLQGEGSDHQQGQYGNGKQNDAGVTAALGGIGIMVSHVIERSPDKPASPPLRVTQPAAFKHDSALGNTGQ